MKYAAAQNEKMEYEMKKFLPFFQVEQGAGRIADASGKQEPQ